MRLYFHYCASGFSNTYLLGTDISPDNEAIDGPELQDQPAREIIIIDPGMLDPGLLGIIEDNDYSLMGVLITHDHGHHVRGLRSILRIYNTDIYSINPVVAGYKTHLVRDGEFVSIGQFKTEIFSIPGHSADSAVFRIDRLLFTGDAITAGLLGSTASSYSAATQRSAIQRKILSLPGDYTILPGHGPPTSLEAERRFNQDLNSIEQPKNVRPTFRLGL